jgi:putative colanic acid biosynthesis acetyltransferase WcaF
MIPRDAAAARPLEGGASFSLGNRVIRAIWGTVWLLLARFTPPAFHPWRALLLRLFGAKLGACVRVHGSVKVWLPANLELGDCVLIGPRVQLYNQGRITIGARSVISQRAHLCASSHDLADPHFQLVLRPIVLGEQCWVAAEAFVGPGVALSDRAVLGARAALFDDAEVGGIYLGNPAQRIGTRRLRAG